tara:strand:- start:3382 stop:4608 length:1227 start_codon:yes stop_codon:yes gene_type:complete
MALDIQNESKSVTIAIISDLHCHHSQKFKKDGIAKNHSYLTTDKPRFPAKEHPVQSLSDLIIKDSIKSDFLLCPGDITNMVDVQGFISGWGFVKEIGEVLGVKEENVLATLGNHDVDSRYNLFDEVFDLAKTIGGGYPLKDDLLNETFWANGFCIIESEQLRILVINSVYFHSNKEETVQGRIKEWQLEKIENELKGKSDDKIQVALFHHHPIEHSKQKLGDEDKIVLGGQLMDILNENKFDLVIHGHKHHPWLRYAPGNGNRTPIFSAGSFAATSAAMVTGSKNTFHKISIRKKAGQRGCGKIETWEYLPNNGWRLAESGDDFFPMYTGFGYGGAIDILVDKTKQIIDDGNGEFIDWNQFIVQVDEINYLTPDETTELRKKLSRQGIITNPELPKLPTVIGRPYKGK